MMMLSITTTVLAGGTAQGVTWLIFPFDPVLRVVICRSLVTGCTVGYGAGSSSTHGCSSSTVPDLVVSQHLSTWCGEGEGRRGGGACQAVGVGWAGAGGVGQTGIQMGRGGRECWGGGGEGGVGHLSTACMWGGSHLKEAVRHGIVQQV